MAFLFTRTIRYLIFLVVIYTVADWWLKNKSYTISAKKFKAVVASVGSGSPLGADGGASALATSLRSDYAHHIMAPNELHWLQVSPATGVHARLMLLHAGWTEYVGVWAAPLDVTGSLGFHYMNQSCTVTVGALHIADANTAGAGRKTYQPGESVRFTRFEAATMHIPQGTFLVCYGRGMVPLSGAAVVLNTAVVHGDPIGALKLTQIYGQALLRETSMWWQELYTYYSKRLLG